MMDIKEIIKWFIPCFHILRVKKPKMSLCICLFLLFKFRPTCGAKADSLELNETKNVDISLFYDDNESDQSDYFFGDDKTNDETSLMDTSTDRVDEQTDHPIIGVQQRSPTSSDDLCEDCRPIRRAGRTFGRPFKKMAQALIPLAFQIGAASTWAVVAAIVGVKTLVVTLIILKLLLVAGAAKIGALFGHKGHHNAEWETPHHNQKEIHLHIHNGHGHSEVHDDNTLAGWSRDGSAPVAQESNNHNIFLNPYSDGPQTISTPYGNYVKVDSANSQTPSNSWF